MVQICANWSRFNEVKVQYAQLVRENLWLYCCIGSFSRNYIDTRKKKSFCRSPFHFPVAIREIFEWEKNTKNKYIETQLKSCAIAEVSPSNILPINNMFFIISMLNVECEMFRTIVQSALVNSMWDFFCPISNWSISLAFTWTRCANSIDSDNPIHKRQWLIGFTETKLHLCAHVSNKPSSHQFRSQFHFFLVFSHFRMNKFSASEPSKSGWDLK